MDGRWECLDGRSVEADWDDYKYETVLVGIPGEIIQIPAATSFLSCGFVRVCYFRRALYTLVPNFDVAVPDLYTPLVLVTTTTTTTP
jgi:hypothetical protein